jgi:hypothetical protein
MCDCNKSEEHHLHRLRVKKWGTWAYI